MMIGSSGNPVGAPKHSDFINNAQYVGLQKTALDKNKEDETDVEAEDRAQISADLGCEVEQQQASAQEAEASLADAETQKAAVDAQLAQLKQNQQQAMQLPSFDSAAAGTSIGAQQQGDASSAAAASASVQSDSAQGASAFSAPNGMTSTEFLQKLQEADKEAQANEKAIMQMIADRKQHVADMWKILYQTNTAIYQMVNEVAQARVKAGRVVHDEWCKALFGGR